MKSPDPVPASDRSPRITKVGLLLSFFLAAAIQCRGQITISWSSATSGSWTTGSNWIGGTAPTNSTLIASITATGPAYTVTLGTSEVINSLVLDSSNATLQVTGAIVSLAPGTAGASAVTAGTLQLDNAQVIGTSTLGAYVFANAGNIQATGGTNYIQGGGGSPGIAFTNTGSVTVTGGSLTLGNVANDVVTNLPAGVITANGGTLNLNGGTSSIVNTGTLEAMNGGVINIGGNLATLDLGGTIEMVSGGIINLTGTLNNIGQALVLPTGGAYTLSGGTISGGTVESGALTFSGTSGTLGGGTALTGVIMEGDFTVPNGTGFYANGGTFFTGGTTTFAGNNSVRLSAGAANALTVASDETWTGAVSVSATAANLGMTNSGEIDNTIGSNLIYGAAYSGFSFTNTATGTVTNGATGYTLTIGQGGTDQVANLAGGTINANGGNISLGNTGTTITNAGLLEATSATSTLAIGTGTTTTWTNTGTIEATNGGTVDLGGSFNEASLTGGIIDASGGTLNITGTLNNGSGTLVPLTGPNSGIYTLNGGIISGGTVDGGALTFGGTSGTLGGGAPGTGVSMVGNFNVPSATGFYANSNTTFTGGMTTFVGSDSLHLSSGTANALTIASDETWTGGVSISATAAGLGMTNDGVINNTIGSNLIYGAGYTGFSFTNSGTVTNSAAGYTLTIGQGGTDSVANQAGGTINANGGNISLGNTGTTITNAGLLEATYAGSTLTIGTGTTTWSSTGTIQATNGGTVDLGGTFNEASLTGGTINASGGTLNITGTLNNASGTLVPLTGPNSGIYTLNGGIISGGTVDGGALTFGGTSGSLGGSAALTGVSMVGNFNVPTSAGFYANSGTTFTGGTTTFAGSDSVHLSFGTPNALTIASGAAWTGGVSISATSASLGMTNDGTINNTVGSNLIYGAGYTGFSFTNSGTVTNSAAGYTLTIGQGGTDQVANQAGGTINANGGNISLGNTGTTITNAGLLEATAAASTLAIGTGTTTWSSTGTIQATNGGTVDLGGSFNEASLTGGTINASGGTLNITGTLNNASGTLVPLTGPNSGIYTLNGGVISGGTVDGGALTFGGTSGTLGGGAPGSGVSMVGNFTVPTGTGFYANSGTVFTGGTTTFVGSGSVHLSAGTANALTVASGETWTGGVSISATAPSVGMTNNGTINNTVGGNLIYGAGYAGFSFTNSGTGTVTNSAAGYTLTIGQGGTDQVANQAGGIINADGGNISLGNYGTTITNAGLLEATSAASTLTIGTGTTTWTSTGTIQATNGGTVDLGGTFGEASLTGGTINASGGTLNITGTLNNASGTLVPLTGPNSGIYTLNGGVISGGTVDGAALTFGGTGGTLGGGAPGAGVSMVGNFTVPSGTGFYANSGTTFTGGTTNFAGSNAVHLSAGTANALTLASGEAWNGGVSISATGPGLGMTNNGAIDNTVGGNLIYGAGYTGFSFTNSGTGLVTNSATGYTLTIGQGGTDQVANQAGGTINANGGNISLGNTGTTITNAGLLEATTATSTLTIGTGTTTNWSSTGTIQATNGGTVDLGGSFNEASLTGGTINASGGTLNITGTLNNASGTLVPLTGPNSGIYTLNGGFISGGTVDGGALTFGGTGGTLGGGAPGAGVSMVGNFTVPSGTGFYANSGTTFTGGTTTFLGANSIHLSAGTANALTIASDETWTGGMGIAATAAGLGVVNNGTIVSTGAGSLFYGAGYGGFTFANNGLLEATSGSLTVAQGGTDTFTDAAGGTVEANGGSITLGTGGTALVTNLSSNTLTGGTWIASGNATLDLAGTTNAVVTNGPATTLVLSGAGSNIESGPANHTLEQTLATNDGTLEVLAGRNFASTSGAFANNGTIQLGGGTLTTTGALTNGSGSALTGFGTFNPSGGVTVGAGVVVSPGSASANQYVNTLSFGSSGGTFAGGGAYTFDIMNSSASSVAGVDNDTINVAGTLTITATPVSPFTISLESINSGTGLPGLANFSSSGTYQWTLLSAGSISGFSASDFTISTSSFSNGLGIGGFNLTSNGTDIFLNFTPVPEPSTWALVGAGAAATGLALLRRRRTRA